MTEYRFDDFDPAIAEVEYDGMQVLLVSHKIFTEERSDLIFIFGGSMRIFTILPNRFRLQCSYGSLEFLKYYVGQRYSVFRVTELRKITFQEIKHLIWEFYDTLPDGLNVMTQNENFMEDVYTLLKANFGFEPQVNSSEEQLGRIIETIFTTFNTELTPALRDYAEERGIPI